MFYYLWSKFQKRPWTLNFTQVKSCPTVFLENAHHICELLTFTPYLSLILRSCFFFSVTQAFLLYQRGKKYPGQLLLEMILSYSRIWNNLSHHKPDDSSEAFNYHTLLTPGKVHLNELQLSRLPENLFHCLWVREYHIMQPLWLMQVTPQFCCSDYLQISGLNSFV